MSKGLKRKGELVREIVKHITRRKIKEREREYRKVTEKEREEQWKVENKRRESIDRWERKRESSWKGRKQAERERENGKWDMELEEINGINVGKGGGRHERCKIKGAGRDSEKAVWRREI
jgi:hypothetical protein